MNPSSRKTNWKVIEGAETVLFKKEWFASIEKKRIDLKFLLKNLIMKEFSFKQATEVLNEIPRLEYLAKIKGFKLVNVPKFPSKEEYKRKEMLWFYDTHGYFPKEKVKKRGV